MIEPTPVREARWLSERLGCELWFKMECWQPTGSFKIRGARRAVAAATGGVVAASTGNHGMAVAWAARERGLAATVWVPEGADAGKVAGIRALGAEVRVAGDDCLITEQQARADADRKGLVYLSPYNDPLVVAGQGGVAEELLDQLPRLDDVFVALGGGGLCGGVGAVLRERSPTTRLWAVSPEVNAAMHASLEAGRPVEPELGPTLSDATAGGFEPGSITFELCRQGVYRSITVPEAAIAAALIEVLDRQKVLVEGAAALAVAGAIQEADALRDRRVAVVLCGGNLSLGTLRSVLCERR